MTLSIRSPSLVLVAVVAFTSLVHAAADLVVSADGSGRFKTVQDAVTAAARGSETNRIRIHIKPGTYRELVRVPREKKFLSFIGDDAEHTLITFNLKASDAGVDGKPLGTFRTPTVQIEASDFSAENLTFENSAGRGSQALALRVNADRAAFRNCRFLGWQDTMLLDSGRQYFENCFVQGHVDFIFGGATAFFEKCRIHCLSDGYITAASTPENQAFGFVFSNCSISGAPNVKSYLGRPWRSFASTTFVNTEMSAVVQPEGWHNWGKKDSESTARYAEFHSHGPGAHPGARVAWSKQLTADDAAQISAPRVLAGNDQWNPALQKR